jgi:hypothetical protein
MPDTRYLRLVTNNSGETVGGSSPMGPPLQPPGGGGTFDGMEARVARLEADVGHIQKDVLEIKEGVKALGKDVSELKINYATVNERMSHLPTKSYIGWWISAGTLLAVGALTLMSKLGWLVAGVAK